MEGKNILGEFFLTVEREGIDLDSEKRKRLRLYHSLLLKWGRKLPLVSKRDLGEGLFKHYFDAIGLLKFISEGEFVDLGTGSGLPGIPMAIFKPKLKGILVEVNLRKTTFLKLTVRNLALSNIKVIRARWEKIEASADYAISKATGQKEGIREHLPHLLKPGGLWIRFASKGEIPLEGEISKNFYNPFRKRNAQLILSYQGKS